MKTLYLHIGTPKTATSSIQKFMEMNRKQLLAYQYCFPMDIEYPDAPSRRNAHFLVFRDNRLNKDPEALKLRDERLDKGLDMIHAAFQNCDNVILSEENLWYATAYDSRNYLQILPGDAEKYGYTIKIIVYLRRQDQFISSVWNQHIKRGQTGKTLNNYIDSMLRDHPLYLEYDRMLQLIADTFGADKLIVRRFEPNAWVNQSVLSDFLDALDLDPSLPLKALKNEINLRLSDNAAEIQRIINNASFLTENEKEYLSKYTKELSLKDKDISYSRFTPAETASFLARFEKGNRAVVQKYIRDDKPLFSDEIKDLPLWKPNNPKMKEELYSLLVSMQENGAPQKDRTGILLAFIFDLYDQLEKQKGFQEKLRHPLHTLSGRLSRK